MATKEPKYIHYQIADLFKGACTCGGSHPGAGGLSRLDAILPLVVVKSDGPTLLGRNWLAKIKLNWDKIHYMQSPQLYDLLSQYDELFQERLAIFKDYEAKNEMDPRVTPRFCKARTVPYAMQEKVMEELDRLHCQKSCVSFYRIGG